MRIYSDPERESDTYAIPDIEVFHLSAADFRSSYESSDGTWMADSMAERLDAHDSDGDTEEIAAHAEQLAGYYYWTCFPGCMPDSDAIGPYDTEAAAINAARAE